MTLNFSEISATLLFAVLFASCSGSADSTAPAPVSPEVEYSINDTVLEISRGDVVDFHARVTTPGPVDCAWYVDGEKMAATARFIFRFEKAGTFEVSFRAFNSAGETERKYTVNAKGELLRIEFSNTAESISVWYDKLLEITARVISGDYKVIHNWTLDDQIVSEGPSFSRTFVESEIGPHILKYRGVNGDDSSVERSWTIQVTDIPIVILTYDDFETGGVPSEYIGNNNALSVVNNPHVTKVNSSAKVLYNNLSGSTGSTSGYVRIAPSASKFPTKIRSKYNRIRVKMWMGTSNYFPYLQSQSTSAKRLPNFVNGQALTTSTGKVVATGYITGYSAAEREYIAAQYKSLVKTDDWNIFEYDPSTWTGLGYPTLESLTTFEFRPLSNVDGSNIASGAASAPDNLRYVYIDDIQLIPTDEH
ncbi:MAG: hypothetical protein MJY62_00060 [Bacteroidales bacterium]|nr:hypothetical protein [Bacteroidales bacterium]